MRKQFFIVAILFVCCNQASSQLEKNKLYSGLFYQSKFNYTTNGAGTQLSYALNKHNLVGMNFSYDQSIKYPHYFQPGERGYFTNYGVGLTHNYFSYFKKSKKFGWSIASNLNFNTVKVYSTKSSGQFQLEDQYPEIEFSVKPGLFYTPTSNIIIFANFGGYSLRRYNGYNQNEFNFARELNIGVLINLDIFRKRK